MAIVKWECHEMLANRLNMISWLSTLYLRDVALTWLVTLNNKQIQTYV